MLPVRLEKALLHLMEVDGRLRQAIGLSIPSVVGCHQQSCAVQRGVGGP